MNKKLVKAYDIIKDEQRNADNKAYIFVLLIGGILGYVTTTPMPTEMIDIGGFTIFIILLAIPELLLLYSLVPKYNVNENLDSKEYNLPFNLFFWKSFVKYQHNRDFINDYMVIYKDYSINQYGLDMLEQVFKNAKIMHRKSILHKISLLFISFIVYLFALSMLFMIYSTISEFILGGLLLFGWFIIFALFFAGDIIKQNDIPIKKKGILVHKVKKIPTMNLDEHRLYAKRIYKYLSSNDFNMISYSDLADLKEVDYKYKHKEAFNQFRSNISVTLGILGRALTDLGLAYIQSLVVLSGTSINGPGYYKTFARDIDIDDIDEPMMKSITKEEIAKVKIVMWDLWEDKVFKNIDRVVVKDKSCC